MNAQKDVKMLEKQSTQIKNLKSELQELQDAVKVLTSKVRNQDKIIDLQDYTLKDHYGELLGSVEDILEKLDYIESDIEDNKSNLEDTNNSLSNLQDHVNDIILTGADE